MSKILNVITCDARGPEDDISISLYGWPSPVATCILDSSSSDSWSIKLKVKIKQVLEENGCRYFNQFFFLSPAFVFHLMLCGHCGERRAV